MERRQGLVENPPAPGMAGGDQSKLCIILSKYLVNLLLLLPTKTPGKQEAQERFTRQFFNDKCAYKKHIVTGDQNGSFLLNLCASIGLVIWSKWA
jgi:hypothetical protein